MQIRKLQKSKFPKSLLEIPQPPDELYIIGELPTDPDLVYLAIVGSRKFTSYGKEVCEKLIAGLKDYPVVIVSGFAMGIDTIAHKKAMQVGLKTIVFPGSGLSEHTMYPKSNIIMMRAIVESGGCLISEFKPDFKATYWSFPMRNRLMAGISKAVLVIEAQERSGTLITARLAVEYNKDLLTVPGNIFSPNAKGTNKLLRMGATPITSPEELLEALGFEKEEDSIEVRESKQQRLFQDLSKEEKKIIELLREPLERDELVRRAGLPVYETNALLSILEIKGVIKEELGEIRLY